MRRTTPTAECTNGPAAGSLNLQDGGGTLPERCGDAAKTIPGHCRDAARTMPGHCQDGGEILPGQRRAAARTVPGHCQDGGGALPEQCRATAKMMPGHCQDGGGTLPERCVNLDPDCHLEGAAARRSKFGCFSIRNHIRNAPFWRGPPDPELEQGHRRAAATDF